MLIRKRKLFIFPYCPTNTNNDWKELIRNLRDADSKAIFKGPGNTVFEKFELVGAYGPYHDNTPATRKGTPNCPTN
jgi:hypothetical protein